MGTEQITIATLRPAHYVALAAILANRRHWLQPQMRDMLKRLGLIVPTEPPRGPRAERRHLRPPPTRAHRLTELGARVLAKRKVAA